MSARALLWAAFAVVHVAVAAFGWFLPNQPMGDVYLVYEHWARAAASGSAVVGITETFVYPHLALLPMLAALGLSWVGGYIVAWAIVVTALDAVAFALLLGDGRSAGRTVAGWFWMAYLALLGPVAIYRIDAMTVPLAVAGLLLLARRPRIAAALLSVGMWIKVWPVALLAAAFVALRRRLEVLGTALAVSAAVVLLVVSAGGAAHLAGFIGAQTGRGLQLEAPVSTVYLWRAVFGVDGSFIFYDPDILTFQVTGPGVDTVIALMTPVLIAGVVGIVLVGAVKARRGASFLRLFPPLALALVLVLIVTNKVGSPQFQTWLIAPLVLWLVLDRRRAAAPAVLAGIVAALTQAIYPMVYGGLLGAQFLPVLLLTLRNATEIALLVVVLVRLVGVPVPTRRREAGHVPLPTP
ncbi:glycosyltransferase 87 family protein [Microbacterium sp. NPDC078428]|uniref:glycosyltransferase 87 family protein n=1 Tax=Microbacterium sp. NPDC078428 TaxID=3364190 RepID=UPI0037C8D834